MPQPLTDLERKILDYMVRYLRTHTYQPSIREIGEAFDMKSTKTVSEYLRSMAEKGYVERDPSRSRGVRILGEDLSPHTVSVPCFRSLPDDRAGFSSDGVEAYYSMDRRMAGGKGSYFVRVRGGEFARAGVEKGDLLLVEPVEVSDVREGDLVVVRSGEGGAGLFRYRRRNRKHELTPAAPGKGPRAVERAEDAGITGRVTGLYRRFEEAALPVSPTAH